MKFVSLCVLLAVNSPILHAADVFERHTAEVLQKAVGEQKSVEELSLDDAIRFKSLGRNVSSPCVVVRTNQGNWAKALIAWGFRRGSDGPVPVLLLERYVTYRGDRPDVVVASGEDVMLFAGLEFNLDIGQVVPAGQGGDITFTSQSRLKTVGEAKLYGLDGSQLQESETTDAWDPNDHEGVLPRDFAGKWHFRIDGRWEGECELKLDENGRLTGKFTSSQSQSRYDVTGRIAFPSHHAKLQIHLDNAEHTIDAYLWTSDKSMMAGTSQLAGRPFGFHAVRQTNADED